MSPLTAKILDRSVLLGATLCLAAKQYDVPNRAFWTAVLNGRGFIVIILVGLISVFGAFTPFQAMAARTHGQHQAGLRQQILAHYGRLIVIAGQASPPIAVDDIGLHVWKTRRTLRHPIRQRLVRVATYRLSTTPATRPFTPQRGVGVVGLCWKRNREVAVDVEALARDLQTEELFNAHMVTEGGDSVMNLTWAEFENVRHRGAVFASPIRDGAQNFVGCVSVDASTGYASLDRNELWHQMNSLSHVLDHDQLRNL